MSRPIITTVAEVEALAAARRRAGLPAKPLPAGLTILRVNLREAEDILRGVFVYAPTTVHISRCDEGVYVEHAAPEVIAELRTELHAGGWEVR
ncbi:hypothetical protein [Nonomuraea sp. SYSU D8015]|uniref:hypothetical protein n=1 Tax=Nonomuraea sp. SYSU D8015 TaxID=2593644 RepID=UPI001660E36D|nr:hypothetical protein [Nonomuraea sp. SYSU D8015]